jgi:hypothetical protein
MRQKYLNNVKVILVLLIGVTILFAILGTFKLLPDREGMDDAPACYSNLHDASDNKTSEKCSDESNDNYNDYKNHHSHEYSDYESNSDSTKLSEYKTEDLGNNDNYMLKTKMVPPKSTPCPTKISSNAKNYLDSVTSSSSSVNDSYTLSESTVTNTVQNQPSSTPETKKESITNSASNSASNTSSQSTFLAEPASIESSYSGSDYMPDKKKEKDKNDSCPPCPACERCPEPAFDCKKVPNYRSPSIGSYLPMPILTDFSKF